MSKIIQRLQRTKECAQSNKSKRWKNNLTWERVVDAIPNNAPSREQFKTITLAEVIVLQMAEHGLLERKLPSRGHGYGSFRLKTEQ